MHRQDSGQRTTRALLALAAACSLVCGCNGGRPAHTAGASAPSLEDQPLAHRGGTNPNAPYTMLATTHQLAHRPALLDPTLAEPCGGAQLSAYESGASVEGNVRTLRISLVNHGAAPCRLAGIPAVSLVAADGTPLAQVVVQHAASSQAAADTATPSPTIVLPAQGESEFQVKWTTGEQCAPVASIAVAAPGTTRSYLVPHPLSVCGDRIVVSEVSGPGEI